ncbi:MAG: hypothetical protein NT096_14250 [Proteobacteria bacterium]|nr:hypothetical protein [Pseudomonadota bacterium]
MQQQDFFRNFFSLIFLVITFLPIEWIQQNNLSAGIISDHVQSAAEIGMPTGPVSSPAPSQKLIPHPSDSHIGVIYVIHGGMDTNAPQYMFDAAVQQFSYDPNHSVYKFVIWNPANWPMVLDTDATEFTAKFLKMYDFSYERIGGTDPYQSISDKQLAEMKAQLDKNPYGITFEVEWAGYMAADHVDHYAYPRFIYYGPDGPDVGYNCNYCGEAEPDGPWPDCDPNRHNVDGPVERLLKKGVSRIIMVDLTVGGPRFSKTYDVVKMTRRALDLWNADYGTSIPLLWVNDYSNLMGRSYPTEPEGWTSSLGLPAIDQHISLNGSPNTVAEDSEIAQLHAEGIEASFSPAVSDANTGVILFNHGLFNNKEVFDPKINDTLIINKNIKAQLLRRHPRMNPDNIIGGYGGIEEEGSDEGCSSLERTRKMRGETYGYAWLYETAKQMPGDEWGFRIWDGLEYLKSRGVKHIVIAFPQVVTDSALSLVEIYNQIGREIGVKTWLKYGEGDFLTYPETGNPFADYWGIWVETDCGGVPCCFVMGGCDDGRPYPPPRLNCPRNDLDPSLAFDLSSYGNLGYDPTLGAPDENKPVQDQYTGTWALWSPPNDDPRLGKLLAKHVMNAALKPMVYITNGEIEGIQAGQSVTWEAHVTGGKPGYTYQWSIKKEKSCWSSVGKNSPTWTWTPRNRKGDTYSIRCKVKDARKRSGQVTWEGFVVSPKL